MSYLKPQTPIELGGNYVYPLTTADQVIVGNGNRLNSLFKKTIQETVILKASNWSESAPYIQTITLTESVDDYKVEANVMYTGNENDSALNKAAGCLSYIKKNRKEITFYCLKNKPEIDIPVEITGTCRNTIATVEDGIKLNFDIIGGTTKPINPTENMIWINTDVVDIPTYYFQAEQPENMSDGDVWIKTGKSSAVSFNIFKENTLIVHPMKVYQMIGGVLVSRDTETWCNGQWIPWCTYIDLTTGWIQAAQGQWWSNGSVSCGTRLTISNSAYNYLAAATKSEKINFNDIDYVTAIIDPDSQTLTNGKNWLAVINSTGFSWNPGEGGHGAPSNVVASTSFNTPGEVTLDVSTVYGEYYLAILATAQKTVYCSEIRY